jgi:hypothetical protein
MTNESLALWRSFLSAIVVGALLQLNNTSTPSARLRSSLVSTRNNAPSARLRSCLVLFPTTNETDITFKVRSRCQDWEIYTAARTLLLTVITASTAKYMI